MLDQNTDRMWYVIGAVLVGAAIILIANGTLPQMFASVSDMFNSQSDIVSKRLDAVVNMGNLIVIDDIEFGKWVNHEEPGNIRSDNRGPDFAVSGFIPVNSGKSYTLRTESKTHNKRIVFFDSSRNYVKGFIAGGITESYTVEAPESAVWARVTTTFSNDFYEGHAYTPVDGWWFGESY